MPIRYRKNRSWKYRLSEDYSVQIPILPKEPLCSSGEYVKLGSDGTLTLKRGYAWDGPSGPTIDTTSFMRGSLVHDALYQIMREGLLDLAWREASDELLSVHCIEDGMHPWRARGVYWGLVAFGARFAKPRPLPKTLTAP